MVARSIFRPGVNAAGCGKPLVAGDLLVQPDLAKTFRLLAAEGTRAFYDCTHPAGIGRAIVATQKATRAANDPAGIGRMTCDDLAAYRAVIREPVVGVYRSYRIESVPPPSSGGVTLLQILRVLQGFPVGNAVGGFGFGSVDTLNVMLEAMRLSFADRAVWVGDTDLVEGLPVHGLINDDYLMLRAGSCPRGNPSHGFYCVAAGSRLPQVRAGDPRAFETKLFAISALRAAAVAEQREGAHTTHITVADAEGNIVSFTTTIESPWGTGLMVPGFGFMLNNELTDFNLVPQRRGEPADTDYDPGANDVAPFKRPRSSMAPTIIFSREGEGKRPVAAYGSPGGASIINTILNVTLDLIDHRLTIREAVERPRISLTSATEQAKTSVEPGFDAAVLERLHALGYRLAEHSADIGAVQAIAIDPETGALYGEADPRRNGTIIGLPRRSSPKPP
jgi:gamma-glutamyltranspeptidase/glutathione hydrolase